MVQKAIDFATKVHEGQYRKGDRQTVYCTSDGSRKDSIHDDTG